ncbi:hypothetical protein E2C01_053387 [Portunus trituberculatus]|uniref:Uncharacterized protein n=1 Tax=Portunus trituberculatus TaxID=210409 RepID=A0A5B7GP30_PORTR|nr:hypothetical protein [Portunus trituberculatus]
MRRHLYIEAAFLPTRYPGHACPASQTHGLNSPCTITPLHSSLGGRG